MVRVGANYTRFLSLEEFGLDLMKKGRGMVRFGVSD